MRSAMGGSSPGIPFLFGAAVAWVSTCSSEMEKWISQGKKLGTRYAREGIRVNCVCPGPNRDRYLPDRLTGDDRRILARSRRRASQRHGSRRETGGRGTRYRVSCLRRGLVYHRHPDVRRWRLPREIKRAVQTGQARIGERLLSAHQNENVVFGFDSVPFLASSFEASERLWRAATARRG